MGNIKFYKMELRKKYRSIRENLKPEYKRVMDIKILKRILFLKKYEEAKTVLTYFSKDIEVDTHRLIVNCWKNKKRVAVPACEKETRKMKFYYINSFSDLEKRTFGLLEPIEEKCEEVVDFSGSICIVPGFCFDYESYRLGYGCGYYDRFLQNFDGTTIGVCYSNCIVPRLPHGRFDKPVDIVITNSYVKEIKKDKRGKYE